jgi:hypothetical protein
MVSASCSRVSQWFAPPATRTVSVLVLMRSPVLGTTGSVPAFDGSTLHAPSDATLTAGATRASVGAGPLLPRRTQR